MIKIFSIMMLFFGYIMCPFLFINQYYKVLYETCESLFLIVLVIVIGFPLSITLHFVYRLLLAAVFGDKKNRLGDVRSFFTSLIAAYSGLAYYFPCCWQVIRIDATVGDAIHIFLSVHLIGIGIAVLARIIKSIQQ